MKNILLIQFTLIKMMMEEHKLFIKINKLSANLKEIYIIL